MNKIKLKKKELELILQRLRSHPEPSPELEQYTTPAEIAADVLFIAYPDIVGKNVLDIGCGTGIFAIGAKILGAKKSTGIDIDEKALAVGDAYRKALHLDVEFKLSRISEFNKKYDTVLMNPPFGAQKNQKHADRMFLKKALELAPVVYSFHLLETENFVENFVAKLNAAITFEKRYKFPIPYTFKFHTKKLKLFEVVALRIERKSS
mgnify:CR=1 FL=1